MAAPINLLPVDLSAKSGVARTAALLKRAATSAAIIFLTLGSLAGGFILLFTLQLSDINKQNAVITGDIAKLESTEQKTVLIKDRLQKIKSIESQADILSAVDGLRDITTSLPVGVSLADVSIDSVGKITFGFNVSDSTILTGFLANLISNSNYKQLAIKSFSFTPATGYLVMFEAITK